MATQPKRSTSGAAKRRPVKPAAGPGKHRGGPATESGAKKAAAREVAGGGPEDPIADVAAGKALLGGGKKKPGGGSGGGSGGGGGKAKSLATKSPLLLAEFIICFVILGLGTLASPKGSANAGIPRLMLKSSALAGVFLILALASSVGGKAQKTAGALGGLVTVTYLVASPDAVALFDWSTRYFGGAKAAQNNASEVATEASADAAPAPTPFAGASQ